MAIAGCYDLDSDGYPLDSAWYRRRIYNLILEECGPNTVLDIGCGGGQTILDALERDIDVIGVEPIEKLADFGRNKLISEGYSGSKILLGDASAISKFDEESFDAVAMLSVIPHVPKKDWESLHKEIFRVLKPGGIAIIAYRNELFDLFTANRFTHLFMMNNFFSHGSYTELERSAIATELNSFIPFYETPSLNHTESNDKSFGDLDRPKSNPLNQSSYLANFCLNLSSMYYCNFHPILPNMKHRDSKSLRKIKYDMELDWFNEWQGMFMSSMFVTVSRKN